MSGCDLSKYAKKVVPSIIAQGNKSAQAICYLQLLPCPFCGGKPEEGKFYKFHGVEWYKASCKSCGVSAVEAGSIEECVEKWNTRIAVWFDIEKYEPELNTWCFVSDGKDTHFAEYMGKLGFLGTDGEVLDGFVKYWMPLPPAPEGR